MDKTNERGPQRGFVANSRRGLVAFPKANTASGGSAVSASSAGAEQQRFAHVPVVEEPVLSGSYAQGHEPVEHHGQEEHHMHHRQHHHHDETAGGKTEGSAGKRTQGIDDASIGFASSSCVPWERYRNTSSWIHSLKLIWSDSRQERTTRTLFYYILLLIVFSILELLYGWKSGSLVLTTGAAHGSFHVFSLCSSLMIMLFARASPTLEYTYGYDRFEVLAAFSNTLLAVFMSLYLMFHSLHHIAHPLNELSDMFVLEFGILRLALNLVGAIYFRPAHGSGKDAESGKRPYGLGAADSAGGPAYGDSSRAAVFGNGEGGFGFGKSKSYRFGRCSRIVGSLCELLGDMRTVVLGRYHQGCCSFPLFFSSGLGNPSTFTYSAAGCANKVAINAFRSCRGTGISWQDVIEGSTVAKYPSSPVDEYVDATVGKRKQRQKVTHSLHVTAVYVHLVADTLTSLAVLISGILLRLDQFLLIDTIQGFVICIFTMYLAIPLLMATSKILLQCVPPRLQQRINRLHREILAIDGILDILDSHYWSLSPGCTVGTMRVLIQGNVDADIAQQRVCELLRPFVWFMTVEVERDTATDWLKDAALPPHD